MRKNRLSSWIVLMLLIFLCFSFVGCAGENEVVFEVERIYISNEQGDYKYPVKQLKISLYGEKNGYVLLDKVFDYDNYGIDEFKISTPIENDLEQENVNYFLPNYTNTFFVKNNEEVMLNIYMVFMNEAREMIWNLSSFLTIKDNFDNLVLKNREKSTESHFRYSFGEQDYCNVNLVIKKIV